MRKFRRSSGGPRSRLVVLGAVLVITIVWALLETGGKRPGPGRSGTPVSRGTAEAAPAQGAESSVDQATPEGWGTDPFDPRPLGTTPVTTGR
jgi:hypothetical protein